MSDEHIRSVIIQEGRQAVLRAFRHDRKQGVSIMAVAAGQRPSGTIQLKATRSQHPITATETRPAGFSKPVLPDRQGLTGNVHRLISDLEQVPFNWVQFKYRQAGRTKQEFGEAFRRTFFLKYEDEHLQGKRIGTRRMARYLIAIAMADLDPRKEIEPDGWDVSRDAWYKTYRPHWLQICADIAKIDREALYYIGSKLGSENNAA